MPSRRLCELCQQKTNWLHRKEAAVLADVTPHTISIWAKTGLLHLWKLSKSRYLICERSLWGWRGSDSGGAGEGDGDSPAA
jgi:hypothetical protein